MTALYRVSISQAGDVKGTQNAEGEMDEPIEAIIKAVKTVDASPADSIEQKELDIEKQADSDKPDLKVIAQDAQDVLALLTRVASAFQITL